MILNNDKKVLPNRKETELIVRPYWIKSVNLKQKQGKAFFLLLEMEKRISSFRGCCDLIHCNLTELAILSHF